jgi:Spy/CpxP family protein refolding chaperone
LLHNSPIDEQHVGHLKNQTRIKSVLTAEQRATLKEMQEKRKSRGDKRGGKRNAE